MFSISTRFSIGNQILLATIIIILIFSSVNVFNYVQSQNTQHNYDDVIAATPLINYTKDINTELWLQNAQIRGYVLTGDAKYLQSFEISRKNVEIIYEKMIPMLSDEYAQKGGRILRVIINEYNKQQNATITARNTLGPEQAIKFVAATGVRTDLIGIALQSFAASVTKDLDAKIADNKQKASKAQQTVLIISILIFIAALWAGVWLARRISSPLKALAEEARLVAAGDLRRELPKYTGNDEIGDLVQAFMTMITNLRTMVSRVNHAAEEVTSSSEELRLSSEQSAIASNDVAQTVTTVAEGASHQLTEIEKAVNISRDMATAINHIAVNATEASNKSSEATIVALTGGKAVTAAISQMKIIDTAVSQSVTVVGRLGDSSREIGEIVDVIRNIAGQTNLLALNAAIEAARAGESGRGFAVVADEVRKLAEQSQTAAHKIAQIVSHIQHETSTAVQTMSAGSTEVTKGTEAITDSGRQFQNIIDLVQNLNSQIMNISMAVQQLSTSSDTVVNSIAGVKAIAVETTAGAVNISAATEEQSASMEQIAASSVSMSGMAEELRAEVNNFKL